MAIFDELEKAAANIIIENDLENGALYRYTSDAQNDGFNKEYALQAAYLRPIRVSIARGATTNQSEYIGTTDDVDVQTNDVIEIVNERGLRRRYVVTGFEPVRDHTYLELDEVRTNGA